VIQVSKSVLDMIVSARQYRHAMNKRLKATILRHSVAAQTEVADVLRATRGNWTQAADRLGITFRQFRYLMKIHGAAIEAKAFGPPTDSNSDPLTD
jgi:transcriptional regulator with GAF, ATPase, and Fis domain